MPLFGRARQQTEPSPAETITCPSCQETAPVDALVCPYCKEVLPLRARSDVAESTIQQVAASEPAPIAQPPSEKAGEEGKVATEATAGSLWCPHCGGEFDNAEELQHHMQLAHARS